VPSHSGWAYAEAESRKEGSGLKALRDYMGGDRCSRFLGRASQTRDGPVLRR